VVPAEGWEEQLRRRGGGDREGAREKRKHQGPTQGKTAHGFGKSKTGAGAGAAGIARLAGWIPGNWRVSTKRGAEPTETLLPPPPLSAFQRPFAAAGCFPLVGVRGHRRDAAARASAPWIGSHPRRIWVIVQKPAGPGPPFVQINSRWIGEQGGVPHRE
jgi:hypothetical protein